MHPLEAITTVFYFRQRCGMFVGVSDHAGPVLMTDPWYGTYAECCAYSAEAFRIDLHVALRRIEVAERARKNRQVSHRD